MTNGSSRIVVKTQNDMESPDEYDEMARRLKIEKTLELVSHTTNAADAR